MPSLVAGMVFALQPHFSDDEQTLSEHRHGVKNIFLFLLQWLATGESLDFACRFR
jgi:hypothetical protein